VSFANADALAAAAIAAWPGHGGIDLCETLASSFAPPGSPARKQPKNVPAVR
jgi:hypothetical protein